MKNLTCKEYVADVKERLKAKIYELDAKPKLKIIQVEGDAASDRYVRGKIKDCEEVGIQVELETWSPNNVSTEDLLYSIKESDADGVILQLPVPPHIDVTTIINTFPPEKDVDGFSPLSPFKPCTPLGIIKYLKACDFEFEGKNAVVLGRSEIVGKPMAELLLNENCTVTVCHSKTRQSELESQVWGADLIVSAVGKEHMIKGNMVNEYVGPVIIDVGINFNKEGKMCGDCDYEDIVGRSRLITPVPGGIGLITRVTLLENVLEAYDFNR